MDNPVLIFGAKGLAAVAQEIFEANGVIVYGFLDDDKTLHGTELNHLPILGDTDDDGFLKLIGQKCEAFVAIDDMTLRKSIAEMLFERRHVMPTNAVHPQAIISKYASLGHGNLIQAGVIINSGADIANHCMLHQAVAIGHQASIGDFTQIGAGAQIGEGAQISEGVFIGIGSTIVPGIKIGKNARIGAGSVVIEDVPAKATVFGNPAKKV